MPATPHLEAADDAAAASSLPPPQRLAEALGQPPGCWFAGNEVRIGAALLRHLLSEAVKALPFDEDFYRARNPDLLDLYRAGEIVSLHRHFIETGFFEGRPGAEPGFDEDFYLAEYPDIRAAVAAGQLASGRAHFVGQGIREGRIGLAADRREAERWAGLLAQEAGRRRLLQPVGGGDVQP